MSEFSAVITGIVSSLIATAFFVGASEFVRRVVLPWYADKIYRGVRVDGTWNVVLEDGDNKDMYATMELQQQGDVITGMYYHGDKTDEASHTLYSLNGVIRDTYFTATIWPKSKDMIDAGTMLLRAFHQGGFLTMQGCSLYVSTEDGVVNNVNYAFRKANITR